MKSNTINLVLDSLPSSVDQDTHHDDCLKLVCLSDTHGRHWDIDVPPGDVLIHCGDFTNTGRIAEVKDFDDWLSTMPHKYKVVVPGNHDSVMDANVREFIIQTENHKKEQESWIASLQGTNLLKNAVVLINKPIDIEGVKFFGTPNTMFNGQILRMNHNVYAYAFGCSKETDISKNFLEHANNYDVLISHSPPLGIADRNERKNRGSRFIRCNVFKTNPSLHIFGHVHYQGGKAFRVRDCPENREEISGDNLSESCLEKLRTTFVNAASLRVIGLGDHATTPSSEIMREPVVIFIHKENKTVYV